MKIVIFGATGGTGRFLVEQALERGHEVSAVARDPAAFPNSRDRLTVLRGNALDADSVEGAVEGQDAVLSVLGTGFHLRKTTLYSQGTETVVRAMQKQGVGRLVVASTAGLNGKDPSFPSWYRFLLKPLLLDRIKYGDMALMEDEVRGSSLDWTVVRAGGLTDGSSTGEYRVGSGRLPEGGAQISRPDLARFMLDLLDDRDYVEKTVTLAY